MNRAENFIAGIVENYDDLFRRLVFADWLEGESYYEDRKAHDPEWAELIRTQVEIHQMGERNCYDSPLEDMGGGYYRTNLGFTSPGFRNLNSRLEIPRIGDRVDVIHSIGRGRKKYHGLLVTKRLGNPDWGEYLLKNDDRSRPLDHKKLAQLKGRERKILKSRSLHEDLTPLAVRLHIISTEIRCGFVEKIECLASEFAAHATTFLKAMPLREVVLHPPFEPVYTPPDNEYPPRGMMGLVPDMVLSFGPPDILQIGSLRIEVEAASSQAEVQLINTASMRSSPWRTSHRQVESRPIPLKLGKRHWPQPVEIASFGG